MPYINITTGKKYAYYQVKNMLPTVSFLDGVSPEEFEYYRQSDTPVDKEGYLIVELDPIDGFQQWGYEPIPVEGT